MNYYQCEFIDVDWYRSENLYTCIIANQQIQESGDVCLIGQHKYGKNDENVTAVWFNNCKMLKLPQRISEKFLNLRLICINNANLKNLNRVDLIEYMNLEFFYFRNNEIEFLPGDLFKGFKNVKEISFWDNKLTFIEPNILDGLDKLEHVNFKSNVNYDICCSEHPQSMPNAILQEVKNDLFDKFYSRFKFVREIKESNKKFSAEIQELKTAWNMEKVKNLELTKNSHENLFSDIQNFTKDEAFKDFKIIIDDREFHVHKFLLSARSPTLAEMLRNNPEAEKLKLVDISVEIFELILNFLYSDELPFVDGMNFIHLFVTAGCLRIEKLKNYAAEELIKNVCPASALEILNISNKYQHNELRQKAFDEIKKNYPKIDFKDEWVEDGEKLCKIIKAFKVREELIKKADEEFEKMFI